MTHLTNYPKLPKLTMTQCVIVFKKAQLGASTVAQLTGYSRQTTTRWLAGQITVVHPVTQNIVSTLAYKVLRALKYKHYPLRRVRNLPATAFDALDDAHYTEPLSETKAEDLLPTSWLATNNSLREEDATV